jgi:hypothetical protein
MKYFVEMGSGGMIYIPSFVIIGSGIRPLLGLVVRVPGYRSRVSGFDPRRYQIF